jgi:hypothetical protein
VVIGVEVLELEHCYNQAQQAHHGAKLVVVSQAQPELLQLHHILNGRLTRPVEHLRHAIEIIPPLEPVLIRCKTLMIKRFRSVFIIHAIFLILSVNQVAELLLHTSRYRRHFLYLFYF